MTLEFEKLPDYGDLIEKEEFIENCKARAFIDYDGNGCLASKDKMSNVRISPSQIGTFYWPEWATHVVWFNR